MKAATNEFSVDNCTKTPNPIEAKHAGRKLNGHTAYLTPVPLRIISGTRLYACRATNTFVVSSLDDLTNQIIGFCEWTRTRLKVE